MDINGHKPVKVIPRASTIADAKKYGTCTRLNFHICNLQQVLLLNLFVFSSLWNFSIKEVILLTQSHVSDDKICTCNLQIMNIFGEIFIKPLK